MTNAWCRRLAAGMRDGNPENPKTNLHRRAKNVNDEVAGVTRKKNVFNGPLRAAYW